MSDFLDNLFGVSPSASSDQTSDPSLGSFDHAVNFTIQHEGPPVADDAGKGPSKFGINKGANPDIDVPNLTEDGARDIYKNRYWRAINGDELAKINPALATAAFDTAAGMGVATANRMVRESGGDPVKLNQLRRDRYAELAAADPQKFGKFLPGWNKRLDDMDAVINGGGAPGAQPASAAPTQYYRGDQGRYGDLTPKPGATVMDVVKGGAAEFARGVGGAVQSVGELGAMAANKFTGTEDYEGKNPLGSTADYIDNSMTDGGKAAAQDGVTGNILDGTVSGPKTAMGTAMMVSKTLGGLAGFIAPMFIPGGPVASLTSKASKLGELAEAANVAATTARTAGNASLAASKAQEAATLAAQATSAQRAAAIATTAYGGAATFGPSAEGGRKYVDSVIGNMSHDDLMKIPAYQENFDKTGDDDQARKAVGNSAALLVGSMATLPGMVSAHMANKMTEAVLGKTVLPALMGGTLSTAPGRVAAGAVTGGAGGAVGMTGFKMAENAGQNMALGRPVGQDIGRDTGSSAVAGAIMGGVPSAVAGLRSPQQPAAPAAPALNSPLSRSVAAAGPGPNSGFPGAGFTPVHPIDPARSPLPESHQVGIDPSLDPNTVDTTATDVSNRLPPPGDTSAPPDTPSEPTPRPPQTPSDEGVSDVVDKNLQPQGPTDGTPPPEAKQAEAQGSQAPDSSPGVARTQVPFLDSEAASVGGVKARIGEMIGQGFDTVEKKDDGTSWLVNHGTNEEAQISPAYAPLIKTALNDAINSKAHEAPSSPLNDKAETQAQIDANNRLKPTVNIKGLNIRIENPTGAVRQGVGPDGTPWSTTMQAHYGEIQGTRGADGDPIDAFIGPNPQSPKVFVIDQNKPDGTFDEHKVMVGYRTADEARAGYLANYEKGWTGLGAMTEMTPETFKKWVKSDQSAYPADHADFSALNGSKNGRAENSGATGGGDQGNGAGRELPKGRQMPDVGTQGSGRDSPVARDIAADQAAVDQLARAHNEPDLTLADPAQPHVKALDTLLDAWAKLTGHRGIAVDSKSNGYDGVSNEGRFFVNANDPVMHVAHTIGHEFKHLSEKYPGIKKLYDNLWGMIDDGGKQAYFEHYLFRKEGYRYKDASPEQLALLKDEMIADFMGRRFNDREWMSDLASKKPALFAGFVKDWIAALDTLVNHLKKMAGIGDVRKNVDRYIKQISDAKNIAMEVAEAWAKEHPDFAKKKGVEDAIKHSRRIDEINELGHFNLDKPEEDHDHNDLWDQHETEADLRAQLEAENSPAAITAREKAPSPNITAADVAKHGMHAEKAYGPLNWQPGMGGEEHVDIHDLKGDGKNSRVTVQQDDQGRWSATMHGVWVGPAALEQTGFATEQGAKDFVQRQVAAYDLRARKFDLASTITKAEQARIVDGWKKIEAMRSTFIDKEGVPNGSTKFKTAPAMAQSLNNIADHMGISILQHVDAKVEQYGRDNKTAAITFTNKQTGTKSMGIIDMTRVGGKWEASANTVDMGKNGLGSAFYQMAAEYVQRQGMTLNPESSLSGINSYRRTEQMLSTGLRTGKTNAMVPHPSQRLYGFNNKAASPYDHELNFARMQVAGLRNVREIAPGLDQLHYDPTTDSFTKGGKDADTIVTQMLSSIDARAFGLGRSTLARAVMTKDMMSGKLNPDSLTTFKAPVLYSERARAEEEYKAVYAAHIGKPTWMKAPGGQPTKLQERQWVQVRTPSFKKWFGDWEKFAGQQGGVWRDAKNEVSKAVDEHGEPMVLYHGTGKGGFVAFRQPGGKTRGDLGIFTTDDYGMASSYVKRNRVRDVDLSPMDQGAAEEAGYSFEPDGNGNFTVIDTDGYRLDGPSDQDFKFKTMTEALNAINREAKDAGEQPGVYAVFANIRNPTEEYFEGANWNGSRGEQWLVNIGGEPHVDANGKKYFSESEAREIAKEYAAPDDEYEGADYMQAAEDHFTDTDSVVREGIKDGYDGAIMHEVVDDGGGTGYDGEPATVIVAFKPEQLKSAEYNSGEFGSTDDLRYSKRQDPSKGDKTDIEKLPKGKPIPHSVAIGNLRDSLELAKSRPFRRGRDLKIELQQRVLDAAKAAGVDLTQRTHESFRFLADMVRTDAEHALTTNANAIGWYNKTVSRALGAVAIVHPEILDQPKNRLAFMWALAVTSNGLKVDKNFELTDQAYLHWEKHGEMPTNIGIGDASRAINKGMKLYNRLVKEMGSEKLYKFMLTEFGAGEIEGMLGVKVNGEWKPTPVRGAAVLGPKIGNGFFSNLNGYFDALTMDRWLMRTWGRMNGTLIGVKPSDVVKSRNRLTKAINDMAPDQRRMLSGLIGTVVKKGLTRAQADALSIQTKKATLKTEKREIMVADDRLDEFRKAANGHTMMLDGQKEAPDGPAERNWIRAVFQHALEHLQAAGHDLNMSDLQALLWYAERKLYEAAKAKDDTEDGYEDIEAPDYANAAYKLAIGNGIDHDVVMKAMDQAEANKTPRGTGLDEAGKAAILQEFRSAPAQQYHLATEVAPNPDNKQLTAQWVTLPTKTRAAITKEIVNETMPKIQDIMGLKYNGATFGTGGYEGAINPNALLGYSTKGMTMDESRALASAVGIVLDQKEQAIADSRAAGTVGVVRVKFDGRIDKHVDAIFKAINDALPEVDAFTMKGQNFDVLNFTDLSSEDLARKINDALNGASLPVNHKVTNGDANSELIGKDSYGGHIRRVRPGSGEPVLERLRQLRDLTRQSVADKIAAARLPGAGRNGRAGAARLAAATDGDGQATSAGSPDSGSVQDTGRVRGGATTLALDRGKKSGVQRSERDLEGLPREVEVDGRMVRFGAFQPAHEAAQSYMRSAGMDYQPVTKYVKADPERATRIAQAFEDMAHEPNNAEVKEAYDAMIKETLAQYQAILDTGLHIEFIDYAKTGDPYGNPRNAIIDTTDNNHMWVFPTDDGFGGSESAHVDISGNPLLAPTEHKISGKTALANDIFRVVHDYFGHVKDGVGFRADGEENAWRSHMAMYSPLARRAATTETRGQNSWVNFGPHAEFNRTANGADTQYAPQKVGLLPQWVVDDGRTDAQYSKRDEPFYSELARQIGEAKMKNAMGGAWKQYIKSLVGKGVKNDEIEWSGVNDFLDMQQGKVSKEQVQQFLDGNGVKVTETRLGEFGHAGDLHVEEMGDFGDEWGVFDQEGAQVGGTFSNRDHANEALSDMEREAPQAAKYAQYTLPGGENYREVLLTLPENFGAKPDKTGYVTASAITDAQYKSKHWDDPNVLAHIRLNDRTDVDGKRVLFVEEVQSDWGQEGKKRGFDKPYVAQLKPGEYESFVADLRAKATEKMESVGIAKETAAITAKGLGNDTLSDMTGMRAQYNDLMRRLNEDRNMEFIGHTSAVPSAPFVTKTGAWLDLALKRVIKMAVDEGYDKVAFVNGDQSAERYDLSKQVKQLSYQKNSDGTFKLSAETDSNGSQMMGESIPAEKLEDYIGKEVAQRIIDGNGEKEKWMDGMGQRSEWSVMRGIDLKVGGEGMKAFYDKIVPIAAGKLAEKLGGAKMGMSVLGKPNATKPVQDFLGGWKSLGHSENTEVNDGVMSATNHDQVVKAIVQAIPVNVVDMLTSNGINAQEFSGNPKMFFDHLPANVRLPVANGFFNALSSVGTRLRTGLRSAYEAGLDKEVLPTLKASDLGLDEGLRILGFSGGDKPFSSSQGDGRAPLSGARLGAESGGVAPSGGGGKLGPAELAKFVDWHNAHSNGDDYIVQQSFTITDKMRESAADGLPMFSKRDQTDTPEFKRWFKGSQARNAKGDPLVLHHGTDATDWYNDDGSAISEFRDREPIWLARNPVVASGYATSKLRQANIEGSSYDGSPSTYPVYASIKKPVVLMFDMNSGPKMAIALARKLGADVKPFSDAEYAYQIINSKEFKDAAEQSGYDGIVAQENGEQTYAAFHPSQIKSAIGNSGEFDPENPGIQHSIRSGTSAWDEPEDSRFDDLIYKMQDKHIDTKRVIEAIKKAVGGINDSNNVYQQEELYHGRTAKRTEDFADHELRPLFEKMKDEGLSVEDVEEYLHARHAKEANDVIAQRNPNEPSLQDGGSGMTNADAAAYMASLTPEMARKLSDVASDVDSILRTTRQMYADYGLESQTKVNGWASMFQHYIPLMREQDGESHGMGIGQGFSVKGKEVKGRTGSKRKVVDILANIAMQREKVITRGEKNRVAESLVGLVKANPNSDFWTVGPPPSERVYDPKTNTVIDRVDPMFKQRANVLVAKIKLANGDVEEQAIIFNEHNARAVRMATALKNLDASSLEGILGISAKITRYFSAINTQYNPVFGVVNLTRDVQDAMINLGATPLAGQQAKIAKAIPQALAGVYKDMRALRKGGVATTPWGQLWEQFQHDGGQTGYRELFQTSKDRAENLQKILTPDAWADTKLGKIFTANGTLKVPMSQAKKSVGWMFDWLSDYNEAMENSTRLAAYKAALDQGMSRPAAASLAKNLTINFNRKGQAGSQAGALYAFFNASMQGTARVAQTMFTMEGGKFKNMRLTTTGKAVLAGGLLLGTMQAIMLQAAGFNEDDPPEFVRQRSLVIPIGGKRYISIPMPQGYSVIPGVGRAVTSFAMSGFKDPAKRAVNLIGQFADVYNPIGNAGLSMQTLAPTALDPLVALTENKDFTGKPIARTSSNKAEPGPGMWKDSATPWGKVIASAINEMAGGNKYVAGVISPTPDQIDYLLGQVTGGVGREVSKATQTATSAIHGEELPPMKIPLVGRFFGNAGSQASQGGQFYANHDRLNELDTEAKNMVKDGKRNDAQALLRQHPESYLIGMANSAQRQIQHLNKAKRDMVEKGASREEVKAQEAKITSVMSRLNTAMEQLNARVAQ